jgi:hypothetical protein
MNAKNLELYSVMGEHDNAGFPLSYCMLSTATSIEIGKRKTALNRWVTALRDTYRITPRFAHTDKDMGEIGMLREVWDPKIQLCWWHLKNVVRERLGKNKLSTTPYRALIAKQEFTFVNIAFAPTARADPTEHEGGIQDAAGTGHMPGLSSTRNTTHSDGELSALGIRPALQDQSNMARQPSASAGNTLKSTHLLIKLLPLGRENTPMATNSQAANTPTNAKRRENTPMATNSQVASTPPNAKRPLPTLGKVNGNPNDKTTGRTTNTFCPAEFRDAIIEMMEKHLCAHPSIPGKSHPSAEGIREWAVRQIYQFCITHDLREVWAYLWENWYRRGRWELWAHSVHDEIPRLKTTMIMESQ